MPAGVVVRRLWGFGPSWCSVGRHEAQKARGDLEVWYVTQPVLRRPEGDQPLKIPPGRACRRAAPGTPVGTVG